MMRRSFNVVFFGAMVLFACNPLWSQSIVDKNQSNSQNEQFRIHEGVLSVHKQTIKFKNSGKTIAKVTLGEPIIVAMAEEPEKWGFFQFPSIYRMGDGGILISWQMRADSFKSYGESNKGNNKMMSLDNGEKWINYDGRYDIEKYSYAVFDGNEYMSFYSQKPTDISKEKFIPNPLAVIHDYGVEYKFFRESEMPEDITGIYLRKWKNRNAYAGEMDYYHAKFNDEGLCRYATDNQLYLLWSGDIRQLNDHSIIGCTYRGFYTDDVGNILPSGISFYKWNEADISWDLLGKIPFHPDQVIDPQANKRKVWGFTEPTFAELGDGTLVCVMRSSYEENLGPMYRTMSKDGGITWTDPEAFTPNGVKPHFLQLGNGTLVLSSGRPGVQLRFNLDGTGESWTGPIDMLPFMNADGSYTREVSCGYTGLLPIDDNSFLLVYSDFLEHNKQGEVRKAIKVRKISVKNKVMRKK